MIKGSKCALCAFRYPEFLKFCDYQRKNALSFNFTNFFKKFRRLTATEGLTTPPTLPHPTIDLTVELSALGQKGTCGFKAIIKVKNIFYILRREQ